MNSRFYPYARRFLLVLVMSLLFVALVNEGAHLLLREKTDRPTQTVELVIPAGTAERVAAGEEPPSIPKEMVFVIGDRLLVRNEDSVPHELGALYIPPGSSASLTMDDANKYTLGCTFTPSRYLNFDVRPRTTALSRLQAFALATPPTTMFFFVYSLLLFPVGESRHQEESEALEASLKSL